jgi:hypothetical protein
MGFAQTLELLKTVVIREIRHAFSLGMFRVSNQNVVLITMVITSHILERVAPIFSSGQVT